MKGRNTKQMQENFVNSIIETAENGAGAVAGSYLGAAAENAGVSQMIVNGIGSVVGTLAKAMLTKPEQAHARSLINGATTNSTKELFVSATRQFAPRMNGAVQLGRVEHIPSRIMKGAVEVPTLAGDYAGGRKIERALTPQVSARRMVTKPKRQDFFA